MPGGGCSACGLRLPGAPSLGMGFRAWVFSAQAGDGIQGLGSQCSVSSTPNRNILLILTTDCNIDSYQLRLAIGLGSSPSASSGSRVCLKEHAQHYPPDSCTVLVGLAQHNVPASTWTSPL